MNHVFHRQFTSQLPTAVWGDGVYLIDASGKRYLDACGGAAVSCLGHSDTEVREAIKDQLDRLPFAHSGFFTTEPMEELADLLAETAPGDLNRIYFTSGGSESVETAIKMARQYFLEIGQPERHRFIARRQSYHGATLGALSVGGNRWRRAPFHPMLIPAAHIAPCNTYRGREAEEDEETYGARVADELEEAILGLGPETVAAFVAETVVGATGGAVPPVPGYFQRIRDICDRYGVLFIADEVMCGMGRCGTTHAIAQEGATPDLMAVAKGLGAGYQPIGAVFVSRRIYEVFEANRTVFPHGHTFMGHAAACAGALATQKAIRDRGLLANVREMGDLLRSRLTARLGNHPHVGDIRGRGLFVGVELVADRGSKVPFDPALKLNARIKSWALEGGLMCYPAGGTADGVSGDHVLLAPPFIVGPDEVRQIVDRLALAVDRAVEDVEA